MRTPISGGGWTPGTPIGRRPEPFPWPAITGSQRPASRNGVKDRAKENATPKDLRHLHSLSPQSNTSSNRSARTSKSHRTTHSASSVNSKGTVQAAAVEDKSFERPSSPKSRNASRSRMHERSDSSLGDREISAAISQHLENISQRAESVNRLRSSSATTPVAERRVQSPHSRNQSRSRPSEPATSPSDQHTIRIAASPSILSDEGRNTRQSLTRATYHQRSNSFPANNALATNDRAGTPNSAINMARPASRAASRGRTPGPKVGPTHSVPEDDADVPPHERASSADSTRNDRLHRRLRSGQSRTRPSRTGRGSSASNNNNNRRHRPDEGPSEGFERVEAIISPSCPVHGRRSSSNRGHINEISIPVSRSPPEPSPLQRPASSTGTSQYLEPGQPEPRRASSGDANQMAFVEAQKSTTKDTQASQNEAAEASDCGSVTETLQTISTPGRSPATPYFNPSTPKAMVFNTNDADVEPLFSGNLEGTAKTPTPRCAELDALTPVEVPASSVA